MLLLQDEAGVETDEDCKVVVPSIWKNKKMLVQLLYLCSA